MKATNWIAPLAFATVIYSCSNTERNQMVQNYKSLHEHDSLLMTQTQADDSAIKSYVRSLNEIQTNLNDIKSREKILSVQGENKNGNTAVADIKAIDNLILESNKEMAALHAKMKKMNKKDADMEKMVASMTTQIAQRDSEITVLQGSLAKSNSNYADVTKQFNDSLTVLKIHEDHIQNLTTAMNTVYYAVGTVKELKDNKVIAKEGGVLGLGSSPEVKPDFNSRYFVKTDLTKLDVIPLNAKFKKLITNHPTESYRVTGNDKADSLWITDHSSFWSENKYLVVAVK